MKTFLALLIVLAGVSPASPVGPPVLPSGRSGPNGQCPAFQYVDRARMPTHLNNDPGEPLIEQLWSRWADERPDIAWSTPSPEATIHIDTMPPGMTGEPVEKEVVARQSSSDWEVHARSRSLSGPLGPWTSWHSVRLSPASQARIATILRDPCLWSAPRILYDVVPLLNGRWDSRPDGPSTAYDVTSDGRRWGGRHFSWTVGPPARLRAILLHEAFGEPEWVEDDIGPDGWMDGPD